MPSRHRALPAWLKCYPSDAPAPGQVPTGRSQETSIIGSMLAAGTAILEPCSGIAKGRIGARLHGGEGTHNLPCAYLAVAVFAGLLTNTLFGA